MFLKNYNLLSICSLFLFTSKYNTFYFIKFVIYLKVFHEKSYFLKKQYIFHMVNSYI